MKFSLRSYQSGTLLLGLSTAALLTACKTTAVQHVPVPSLSFDVAEKPCTENIVFSNPVMRTTVEKEQKREVRNQRIYLKTDMGSDLVDCVEGPGLSPLPYAAFEIPTGFTNRVVSAGSRMTTAIIFAADVFTYDDNGQEIRSFKPEAYRRLGDLYGVQFSPRDNEKYVVIKANPALIGEVDSTVETGTYAQNVGFYNGVAYSSGTNTVGVQRAFDRTYSYNGEVAVMTVFPKQEKPKK